MIANRRVNYAVGNSPSERPEATFIDARRARSYLFGRAAGRIRSAGRAEPT